MQPCTLLRNLILLCLLLSLSGCVRSTTKISAVVCGSFPRPVYYDGQGERDVKFMDAYSPKWDKLCG